MNIEGQPNQQELKFEQLLSGFLRNRNLTREFDSSSVHLDEDSLNAFVEGNVGELESPLVVSHLVDCTYCLNVTGRLARLNAEVGGTEEVAVQVESQPTKVSEILSSLFGRIFGSTETAVFAHEEKDKDEPDEDKSKDPI